jgi:hypothetical protein
MLGARLGDARMIWLWIAVGVAALYYLGKAGLYVYAVNVALHNASTIRNITNTGDASQIKELDHEELRARTEELESLGFVVLGDLISKNEPDPNLPQKGWVIARTQGVGRVFGHPVHGCYANLTSAVTVTTEAECSGAEADPTTEIAPFQVAIISLSGSEPDSWTYGTYNRPVQPLNVLMRHPRGLSHCLAGASPERLLAAHLAEREPIAKRAGITWDREPTFAKYLEYEERVLPHLRNVYRRAKASHLIWLMFSFRFKKYDRWMGELGRA